MDPGTLRDMDSASLTTIALFLGVTGSRRQFRVIGTTLTGLFARFFDLDLSFSEHFYSLMYVL